MAADAEGGGGGPRSQEGGGGGRQAQLTSQNNKTDCCLCFPICVYSTSALPTQTNQFLYPPEIELIH